MERFVVRKIAASVIVTLRLKDENEIICFARELKEIRVSTTPGFSGFPAERGVSGKDAPVAKRFEYYARDSCSERTAIYDAAGE